METFRAEIKTSYLNMRPLGQYPFLFRTGGLLLSSLSCRWGSEFWCFIILDLSSLWQAVDNLLQEQGMKIRGMVLIYMHPLEYSEM